MLLLPPIHAALVGRGSLGVKRPPSPPPPLPLTLPGAVGTLALALAAAVALLLPQPLPAASIVVLPAAVGGSAEGSGVSARGGKTRWRGARGAAPRGRGCRLKVRWWQRDAME